MPRTMHLHNSTSKRVEQFALVDDVSIYVCGVTPYDAGHIGHAATFLTFDLLRRHLTQQGTRVKLVRNVTDVDDDILRKARQLGVDYETLGLGESARLENALTALNVLPPTALVRASSAIPEIISMVDRLVSSHVGYQSGANVYFDSQQFARLGSLFGFDEHEMLALAATNGADIDDVNKRHPLDFILWQESAPDEPSWDSPWGKGRPGWHIECSALCLRELGPTVDIHGGGSDLRFPHHECEHAQSSVANGSPLARHWVHQEVVLYEGTKMSKSLGNLVFIHDLLSEWPPAVVRLAIIENHYRSKWTWDSDLLHRAQDDIEHWTRNGSGDAALESVVSALNSDLDVAGAVESIRTEARKGRGVSSAVRYLGLDC